MSENEAKHESAPRFDRYIGIDDSGAATPTSSLKRCEIGVRMALGTRPSQIVWS